MNVVAELKRVELVLPTGLRDVMLGHLERAKPAEACGYFVVRGSTIVEVVCADNVDPAGWKYELDSERTMEAIIRQESGQCVGIFHSHPVSPPRPSQIDVLQGYVGWPYIIVGLAAAEPQFSAYLVEADGYWQDLTLWQKTEH